MFDLTMKMSRRKMLAAAALMAVAMQGLVPTPGHAGSNLDAIKSAGVFKVGT